MRWSGLRTDASSKEKLVEIRVWLFPITDGLTWKQRTSDLKKILNYQHDGDITRIYTYVMEEQFEADLRQLNRNTVCRHVTRLQPRAAAVESSQLELYGPHCCYKQPYMHARISAIRQE